MTQLNHGQKHDHGKTRWELVPIEMFEEIAKLFTAGAKKYQENSWQNVKDGKDRYYAAAMRHLAEFRKGNIIDEELGFRHLTHAAWNIMVMDWLGENEKERWVEVDASGETMTYIQDIPAPEQENQK